MDRGRVRADGEGNFVDSGTFCVGREIVSAEVESLGAGDASAGDGGGDGASGEDGVAVVEGVGADEAFCCLGGASDDNAGVFPALVAAGGRFAAA